jgi:pimeloyl-ACP methyl ester carboxylesterase
MPFAKSRAAEIYYDVHGEGPPIVLVHGAGGNTVVWWQQIPAFSREHTVVVLDHRCFGRSRCAKADFRPEWFADDLIAVLDAAGIERAALVGMSMGGWTVLPAAVRFPERVTRLVLCGTPGGLVTDAVLRSMAEIGRGASEQPAESLQGAITFSDRFVHERPEMIYLYDQISALNTGFEPSMLSAMAAPAARLTPEDLADYSVPTLMIAAEHDRLFPPAVLREVAAHIPSCEWADFPGVGHSMYFEDAARFEDLVLGWLDADRS